MINDASHHIPSEAEIRHAARIRFLKARRAAIQYERNLVQVGRHVGQIINGFTPDGDIDINELPALKAALQRYSDLLDPWARSVTIRMQNIMAQKNIKAWEELARSIGQTLRNELQHAPVASAMKEMLAEQIELIKSIPTKAAERVHNLAIEAFSSGGRAASIQKEIMRSGRVSANHALLIGRTEIARTGSVLTEVRARHIGSEGYFWRTSLDSDVRREHKRLEGKFIRWDDPPIAGPKGERYHAGRGPRCRCYEEPAIPDQLLEQAA